MKTDTQQVIIDGLPVYVVRKAIKNLYLTVHPPLGHVRVTAPRRLSDQAVRLAIFEKLGWIRRQQAKLEARPKHLKQEMVDGESHYFLGQPYRLQVTDHEGPGRVVVHDHATIEIHVRRESSIEERDQVLQQWYRRQLQDLIPPLLEKWQWVMNVQAAEWRIRKMKTRWGSCSINARRIWLNLELAKRPLHCLEYVVVHELAHLIERLHNHRFRSIMDKHLPQWRTYRKELNSGSLAHEAVNS